MQMTEQTNQDKLIEILTELGFLFSMGRTDYTYAYDFIRSKAGRDLNLSRSDDSQHLRHWIEKIGKGNATHEDARLLLTICYVFEANLTNVPLSKLVAFTQKCAEAFDLTTCNGGQPFDFDHPQPAFLPEFYKYVEWKTAHNERISR